MNLSRKYRPKSFSELIGQEHVRITLENEVKSGALAHAFLFSGPRGLGKTTVARILARAANCQKPKGGEPCNECAACQRHLSGKSIDLIEIDAASHTGVDNVREQVIENVRFAPNQEKNKVFIIDEVHMLSAAAFNALLKTLEEPPERVIFIMATTEAHRLPETIVSRCQRFDFKKVGADKMTGRLRTILAAERRDVADEVLFEISRASGGCIRDAETLLDQVLAIKEGRIELDDALFILPQSYLNRVLDLLEKIAKGDEAGAIGYVNECAQDGVHMAQFSQEMIEALRKVLLGQAGQGLLSFAAEFSQDTEERFSKLISSFSREQSVRLLNLLLEAKPLFGHTAVEQFPLEVAIMQYFSSFVPSSGGTTADRGANPSQPAAQPKKEEAKPAPQKKAIQKREIAFEKLEKGWPDVISVASDFNHSLKLILGLMRPARVEGGRACFFCPHKFHKEKLEEPQTRAILDKLFGKVYGHSFDFVIEIHQEEPDNSPKQDKKEEPGELGGVLEAFGGEVVS